MHTHYCIFNWFMGKNSAARKLLLFVIAVYCTTASALCQDQLQSKFSEIGITHEMMGGSLVIFCKNGVLETSFFGKADYHRNIATTEETKYRAASISKTIAAIAAMQLVERGLLDLDEDISAILGYRVSNPHSNEVAITTRMLLSHTSTIIDGPTYRDFINATSSGDTIPDLREILTPSGRYYNATQFNSTEPGHYFNYSNMNYAILGSIIEKVSQRRFDEYCLDNISRPLGIDASFNVNHIEDINKVAVLYRKIDGSWLPQRDDYKGEQPIRSNLDGYVPGTNGALFEAYGGMRISAVDIAKIFMALMNDGTYQEATLLSPESCRAMLADEWTFDEGNGNSYGGIFRSWGLGVQRITSTPGFDVVLPGSVTMYGHLGEAWGLVSSAYFDTLRRVGFVFLTNGVGTGFRTNENSLFYTVEQDVFNAIESFGNIAACSQASSIAPPDSKEEGCFPNPASDNIVIRTASGSPESQASIYSTNGVLVKNFPLHYGTATVDISLLNSGMYVIIAGAQRWKFIKL